ncbi:MAG: hypothetical protein LBI61_01270 [Puniceicoccales bacterium]|jgi:hypothetical protein|nr:hypothetical protein [Puniceicoccales bacterium]
MATTLHDYISRNKANVANTLNGLGLWYLSPCTDVGFKNVMNGDANEDKARAIRFVSSFCKLLDKSTDPSCRMLGDGCILNGRQIQSMEKIPESLDYIGVANVPNDSQNVNRGGGRGRGRGGRGGAAQTGLPQHPRIDSGFIAACNDDAPTKFKIGIEMQVANEGNMAARISDYGARIFKYKKDDANVGYLKTYELALVRWGVEHSPNKILSCSGVKAEMCDAAVSETLVNGTPLCCAHIFLDAAVKAMDVVLRALQNNHTDEDNWTISANDEAAAVRAISAAKDAQRTALIEQMRILFNKGRTAFKNWTAEEKKLVNRIGFFKYGHLMSQADVNALDDNDLKGDYECMKIKEESIMNNISDIEAIYGKVYPHDLTVINENAQLRQQVTNLQQQLQAYENQDIAPKPHKKTKWKELSKRSVKTKKSKFKRKDSDSSTRSTSESSSSDSSLTTKKKRK